MQSRKSKIGYKSLMLLQALFANAKDKDYKTMVLNQFETVKQWISIWLQQEIWTNVPNRGLQW